MKAAVLYTASELWTLPNVATLAGIHRALPLPVMTSQAGVARLGELAVPGDLPVAFDARGVWQDAREATQWAVASLHPLCNSTASLVVLQVTPYPVRCSCSLACLVKAPSTLT